MFYYVNDNKLVDFKCHQLMRCILYYASSILITNAKIEASKGLFLNILLPNIFIKKKMCSKSSF
jgi:hypothetical protein